MLQDGIQKVLEGITTVDELERKAYVQNTEIDLPALVI
jgi:hypothetical protein